MDCSLDENELSQSDDINMTNICVNCLATTRHISFVHQVGKTGKCSYCRDSEMRTIVAYTEFLEYLIDYVETEFQRDIGEYRDDDGNCVVKLYDGYDIMSFLGLDELNKKLSEALLDDLGDSEWIKEDPLAPTIDESQSSGWERFKEAVKFSHRYTFWNSPRIESHWRDSEDIEVSQVPAMLMEVVAECVDFLPEATTFYRVQIISKDEGVPNPERFTSPPKEKATQPNRMSPAGVPMFYGATDFGTALLETVNFEHLGDSNVYGLAFESVNEMALLDLTKAFKGSYSPIITKDGPKFGPSFNDDGFLRAFAQDLSSPILHDGRQHIEYVPTQVFTEYVRYLMTTKDGQPIRGIKYTSSKNGKPCFVLFATDSQCLDGIPTNDGPQLLRPVPNSLKQWKLTLAEVDEKPRYFSSVQLPM